MQLDKFLVVHDPTQEEQPALERAVLVANRIGATLHLFGCIYDDVSGADKASEPARISTIHSWQVPLRRQEVGASNFTRGISKPASAIHCWLILERRPPRKQYK